MLQTKLMPPGTQGISSRHIIQMIKRLEKHQIPMHSILLMRHDQLVYEGYYKPYDANRRHRMFSISKSVTSLCIGHLMTKGILCLDDPIVKYFPEKCPEHVHPWIEAMTIRNMLEMRSCHSATTYKIDLKGDWVGSFFTATPDHPAGTVFHYDTSSPHVLCALVEKLTGKPLFTYFREDVVPELALSKDAFMVTDPQGVSMGGSGLCCTSMDMLKLGYFLLNMGNLDGRQVIDKAFMQNATGNLNPTLVKAPLPSESKGYGYQIWQHERGGCVCYGMGGQLVIVLPKEQLVCVTTADTQGYGGGNQVIYDAFYEEVLDHLSDEPITGDDEDAAYEELSALTDTLSLPVLSGVSNEEAAKAVSGKSYKLLPNSQGFAVAGITFGDGEGVLTLEGSKATFQIPFGLGQLKEGHLSVCEQFYVASGAWLNSEVFYIKCHICDTCVGSVHIQLHFKDNQITIYDRIVEENLSKAFPTGHFIGYLD